jgi:hypothetical protein
MTQDVRKIYEIEETLIQLERTGDDILLESLSIKIKDLYFCSVRLIDLISLLVSLKRAKNSEAIYSNTIQNIQEYSNLYKEAYKSIEKIVTLIVSLNIHICATLGTFNYIEA